MVVISHLLHTVYQSVDWLLAVTHKYTEIRRRTYQICPHTHTNVCNHHV